jgi:hypothetical protein
MRFCRAEEWRHAQRASDNGSRGLTGVAGGLFHQGGPRSSRNPRLRWPSARFAVGLLDLDHDLGDVFAYFDAEPSRTLQELLTLDDGADAEAVAQLGTPLAKGITGFGSRPDPRAEPIPGAAIARMLSKLKDAFAFSVVDATSEYSDHVLAALDLSDAICLVTGLDAIGVRHMSIAIQTLQNLGVGRERLHFVVNRADSKVDLTIQDIERLLEIHVDSRISESVSRADQPGQASGSRAPLRRRQGCRGIGGPTHGKAHPGGRRLNERRTSTEEAIAVSLAERLSREERPDRSVEVRDRVQERLVEVLGARLYDDAMSDVDLRRLVDTRLRELLGDEQVPLSIQEKAHIIQQIGDNILGLGPLEPFVRDPEITEIGERALAVYIERGARSTDGGRVQERGRFQADDRQDRGQGRSACGRRFAVRRRPLGRRISRERDHPASCRQGLGSHSA